jgi:hypothetical protein
MFLMKLSKVMTSGFAWLSWAFKPVAEQREINNSAKTNNLFILFQILGVKISILSEHQKNRPSLSSLWIILLD